MRKDGQNRPSALNFAHSLISPAQRFNFIHYLPLPIGSRLQSICLGVAWASVWSSEEVISRLHVQACQNRCHDSDHTFAAFVHRESLQYFALCSPSVYFLILGFNRAD
jgi:hypothetical protein